MNTREDVVVAAGRLFAERGYHGTSMRDLGNELGLLGSSLYSHVDGKQALLVEVVNRGARFFQDAADTAVASGGTAPDRLRALIAGHIDVVLDHRSEVRTYLNEATALDDDRRAAVIAARDHYEASFRAVLEEGCADGSFRSDVDVVISSIFVLSILNAIERWYRLSGRIDRGALVDATYGFVIEGVT
ncbi:MAG: TetR/AcrR family transcriptional regulator [Actinobacteria bacterium]|nr:TetR/AcrR family transcriptional regulator [Actinomycetota bacterium]